MRVLSLSSRHGSPDVRTTSVGSRPWWRALAALLFATLARAAVAASGTDMGTGYTWRDSADGATAEPAGFDAAPADVSPADDSAPLPVVLPFPFPLYGTPYGNMSISDNGWVSFGAAPPGAVPSQPPTIPSGAPPDAWIAAYWDQLREDDALVGLRIRHGSAVSGQAYLVECAARQLSSGALVSWRLYLYRSGHVRIQYGSAGPALAGVTVGAEDGLATDGIGVAAGGGVAPGVPTTIPAGYVIELAPPPLLSCGALAGSVDLGAARAQALSGDTTGGTDVVQAYPCDAGTVFDGPERVYELLLPQPGWVLVFQSGGAPGLSFFILSACNEGTCVGSGAGRACAELPAGTHYLVVDGAAGAAGPFDVTVAYEEPFNRWDACQDPFGSTSVTDTVRDHWAWSDGAPCYTDPLSRNFPNGCTFAMYVTVPCGTSLHLPMFDVESGHVRVFDVLRGRCVMLVAQGSGGVTLSGCDIAWEDCTGANPSYNNQIMDVSFQDPDGLCGIYRVEFPLHAGSVWDLVSNCLGDMTPQFDIHDSACGALAAYAPLPSLSLDAASIAANCPDVTVTYTVRNRGCVAARDVEVRLLDDGVEVATDVLPEAPPGATTTRSFAATFTALPTTNVMLVLDPDDRILECDEAGGVACDVIPGTDVVSLPGCASCQVLAAAVALPATICEGGSTILDASASATSGCPGGLEYQLSGPGGILAPWGAAAVFPPQSPGQDTDYVVEVRCAAAPACGDTTTVRVAVERPPLFDALSVDARDVSSCNLGIRVSWTAATFFGPAGSGAYNVYRSTVSCADALARPALAPALSGTSWLDTSTVDAVTYFYVVEAEDASPAVACPGGASGGPFTRVDAVGGTCTGVAEVGSPRPDLLPRVGGSLRLGGGLAGAGRRYADAFVDLGWTTDRGLDVAGGEHFHVSRSGRPDAAFAPLLIEPPLLTLPASRDANADDTVGNVGLHVWHYLVYVSDACENDARNYDNP